MATMTSSLRRTNPKSEVVNSFGVSDHFEMGYALNTINQKAKTGKPFMATILTVSNHPPYIIPDFFKPKTKEKETQIVEYADWAIGDFLKKASREPWYKNTIFVIQADHGKLVGKSEGELPQSYKPHSAHHLWSWCSAAAVCRFGYAGRCNAYAFRSDESEL